jgi:L-aspartate oxidase
VSVRLSADFLIIGSGIAGLRAAVELQSTGRVLLLTKSDPGAGSTGFAQGGIAAAVGPDDSADLHFADTMGAGDGLCDAAAVRILVELGPRYVRELEAWGAAFDRRPDGTLDLAREGAHAVRRVLHAQDATGREISRTIARRLLKPPQVTVVDHALAIQIVVDEGRVAGVRYIDGRGETCEAGARATLIATGGAGQVYRETTNPAVATGDGVALAYLAGAVVTDMEFVQFHPTALAVPGEPRYLLSEALRGEGARLVNASGEAFMSREDPLGDLAPRDRVARAILRESERTGAPVYLTLAHLPPDDVRARFPMLVEFCRKVGLDLATDRLPVSPAAHYVMGGVRTDLEGRTSIAGLYAAGEAACTGVHGANRLASNSLLEGLVFGGRAADAMRQDVAAGQWQGSAPTMDPAPSANAGSPVLSSEAIADLMWRNVGVFRDGPSLRHAVATLDPAWTALDADLRAGRSADVSGWRARSLTIVACLIAHGALAREESRGGHWRRDFPQRDDLHWKHHLPATRP